MTKNLVWRLQEKPTTEDITRLIEAGVITKQEAKDVFFREEDKPKKATTSEIDSVRDEIKLLRELVLEIAKNRNETHIIYEKVYPRYTTHHYAINDGGWLKSYGTYLNCNGYSSSFTSAGQLKTSDAVLNVKL